MKFVLIKNLVKGLPKSENRKLLEGECNKKIEIHGTINADQVKAKVLHEFTGISVTLCLQLDGGIHLIIPTQKDLK